jgi:hypothetical protein
MLNFAASVVAELLGKGMIFQPFQREGGFIENIKPTRPDHQHGGPKSNIEGRHLGSLDRAKQPAKSLDALFMNAPQ